MRRFVMSVLFLVPTVALAQSATDREIFGPADPRVKGPPVSYQSVFGAAAQPSETEETPWSAANEEVGRIGGHIGYMRDEAPTPAQARVPHEGHGAPASAAGK